MEKTLAWKALHSKPLTNPLVRKADMNGEERNWSPPRITKGVKSDKASEPEMT